MYQRFRSYLYLKSRCRCYLYLTFITALFTCGSVDADILSEQQIKASYIYNFAKFAEWPVAALPEGSDIHLCLLGGGPVSEAVTAFQGHKIGHQHLQVIELDSNVPFTTCHLLFISNSHAVDLRVVLNAIATLPILTISDIDDFARKGGGIGLLLRENKVRFDINLETVNAVGVHLPGQLLNIANHVYGN